MEIFEYRYAGNGTCGVFIFCAKNLKEAKKRIKKFSYPLTLFKRTKIGNEGFDIYDNNGSY